RQGKIVQQFVDTTYDVLCSTESFFEKINVHIIQCDLQVRSDTKITSVQEMNQWRQKIDLHGFSGTDFRPAFRYIQELRQKGEFDDLAGVIYFTDGWGIYPETMPPFKAAFIFYDEDHRPDLVPAWAIQLTINSGQFESLSVY
ncbi:MAG: VWA-like domain-containing protein, partial [Atopobium minutum]|nr:VWA-like domain-containing protein [Atopobium minutum]